MIIRVTCAIICHEGLYLVTQRSERMSQPLRWEFPGGKIEPGETPEACLLREIREELSLDIELIRPLQPAAYSYEGFTIRLIPFLAQYKGGTIHLAEHQAYRWVSQDELGSLDWAPADIAIVEELLSV